MTAVNELKNRLSVQMEIVVKEVLALSDDDASDSDCLDISRDIVDAIEAEVATMRATVSSFSSPKAL